MCSKSTLKMSFLLYPAETQQAAEATAIVFAVLSTLYTTWLLDLQKKLPLRKCESKGFDSRYSSVLERKEGGKRRGMERKKGRKRGKGGKEKGGREGCNT